MCLVSKMLIFPTKSFSNFWAICFLSCTFLFWIGLGFSQSQPAADCNHAISPSAFFRVEAASLLNPFSRTNATGNRMNLQLRSVVHPDVLFSFGIRPWNKASSALPYGVVGAGIGVLMNKITAFEDSLYLVERNELVQSRFKNNVVSVPYGRFFGGFGWQGFWKPGSRWGWWGQALAGLWYFPFRGDEQSSFQVDYSLSGLTAQPVITQRTRYRVGSINNLIPYGQLQAGIFFKITKSGRLGFSLFSHLSPTAVAEVEWIYYRGDHYAEKGSILQKAWAFGLSLSYQWDKSQTKTGTHLQQ